MSVNFTGLVKVADYCYRNTEAIKGFGGIDKNTSRIHYMDGSTQKVNTNLDLLKMAFEISSNTGKTIDATSEEALLASYGEHLALDTLA